MDFSFWTGEQVVVCHDREVGLRAVIAIDDTTLGPALGGVRYRPYADAEAAIREAQRLAAAMTRKNAAAGLPFGGGKSVIVDDGPVADRAAFMKAFGAFVARCNEAYLPGVDMGTTPADLALMGEAGATVSCHEEDPSPWTALGVSAAIHAAVRHVDGIDTLDGITVLVQGAGHVGASLARLVADSGARVLVSDVDAKRAQQVADELGGSVVAPDAVATTECDVYAPCAIARVVNEQSIETLACRIVAGAANDTLADATYAARLADRGITYVPDFLANAGGVIHIQALRAGWDQDRLRSEVLAVGDRVSGVLADAVPGSHTPLDAAEELARVQLGRPTRLAA
ncbi:MAG: Glu/Leu/Phe/Val dehydrogenase [Conexibacter sp.]|nr:Glu/Leu/Phe/Val dehydrogenase [Conexibacter sp.]